MSKKVDPTNKKPKGQFLLRQRRLAKLLAGDGGKTPLGTLMLRAGYKKGYANSPDKLKKTVSWEELMERDFSDNALSKVHNKLLNAVEVSHYDFPFEMRNNDIKKEIEVAEIILHRITVYDSISFKKGKQIKVKFKRATYSVPVYEQRRQSLDMAYKLKNKYPPAKLDLTSKNKKIVSFNYFPQSNSNGGDSSSNQPGA